MVDSIAHVKFFKPQTLLWASAVLLTVANIAIFRLEKNQKYAPWRDKAVLKAETERLSWNASLIQLPVFAYLFQGSGLGSQIMNFFAKALLLQETQNRTPIAIETTYGYR